MSTDEQRSTATIIGRVETIGEVQTIGAKGFQKREVVIESEHTSKWPQLVAVVFAGKNLDKANALNLGDEVVIDANLRGRRSANGRVFTDIDAWRVKVTSAGSPPPPTDDDQLPF